MEKTFIRIEVEGGAAAIVAVVACSTQILITSI
jgi:hypothetical protein